MPDRRSLTKIVRIIVKETINHNPEPTKGRHRTMIDGALQTNSSTMTHC